MNHLIPQQHKNMESIQQDLSEKMLEKGILQNGTQGELDL